MKYRGAEQPEWKGKPKASPLDTDVEYLKLRHAILSGEMKPFEGRWMHVYEDADSKRFHVKHPQRLVKDHIYRMLKDAHMEADYRPVCRQTSTPGMWGVGVVHEPRESAIGLRRARRHKS